MAEIDKSTVEYVSELAQLTLDDAAKERLAHELADILGYIEKLGQLDTSEIEPMMHVLDVNNVFREDKVVDTLDRDAALMNAPETDGEYFLVPRILDTTES